MKQISISLANKLGKQITGIMTSSKSTANASRSCKRNDTDGVCWWHWTDHYIVETYAMTSLLKVKCRGIWLCKLTYLVINMLTLNKSDLHQTNTMMNIYKQWPAISPIRTTIYEMPWSLSSVLTLHRSMQLKLNADVNWTVKRTQKQRHVRSKTA